MSLPSLPDELILYIIELVQLSYSVAPNAAATRFHNWTEQCAWHLSCLDDTCRDILSLSASCRRLHKLAYPLAYASISPRQWTYRGSGQQQQHQQPAYNALVKSVYAAGQQSIAQLGSLPGVRTVTLHDMWEYSALFHWPIRQPDAPLARVRRLRCVNCSLGRSALRELLAAFPRLDELWYEHGVYETALSEPRRFWDAGGFGAALGAAPLAATLRTLVLTRETDALLSGHRAQQQQQQQPAYVDLRALWRLEHLRIAEVFLFCTVQELHHQVGELADRLPSGIRTLAVFYDEPREVRFEWSAPPPPGLESASPGTEAWPRWPLGLAEGKLSGSLACLDSVTVLERARPQPPKYGHLDDDHDGVEPEEEPNRVVKPPRVIARACDGVRIQLLALANVGARQLR